MTLFSFISPRRLKEPVADAGKKPAPVGRVRADSVQTPRTQSHTSAADSARKPSILSHHSRDNAKRMEAVTRTKINDVKRKLSKRNIPPPTTKALQVTNAAFRLEPQMLPGPLVTKEAPRPGLVRKPTIPRLHEGQVKSSAEIFDPLGAGRPSTPPSPDAGPSSVPQTPESEIHPAFRACQPASSTKSAPLRTSQEWDVAPSIRVFSPPRRTSSTPPRAFCPLLPTPPSTPETPETPETQPHRPHPLKRGISERPPTSPTAPARLKSLRRTVSQRLPRLHKPLRGVPEYQRSFVGISLPYNAGGNSDASITVPAFRYEAMRRDTEQPMLM